MTAKDFVPSYLTPIEGPELDAASRTLSWDASLWSMSKDLALKMQINAQANLPADQDYFQSSIKPAWSNNLTDDDSSQLFIEKQVSTPPKVGGRSGIRLLILTGSHLGWIRS